MYTSGKFGHTCTFFSMTIFATFLNNNRKSKSLIYEIAQVDVWELCNKNIYNYDSSELL